MVNNYFYVRFYLILCLITPSLSCAEAGQGVDVFRFLNEGGGGIDVMGSLMEEWLKLPQLSHFNTAACNHLLSEKLTGCDLTDELLSMLIQHCPNLERLDLGNNMNITKDIFLSKQLKHLKTLIWDNARSTMRCSVLLTKAAQS